MSLNNSAEYQIKQWVATGWYGTYWAWKFSGLCVFSDQKRGEVRQIMTYGIIRIILRNAYDSHINGILNKNYIMKHGEMVHTSIIHGDLK